MEKDANASLLRCWRYAYENNESESYRVISDLIPAIENIVFQDLLVLNLSLMPTKSFYYHLAFVGELQLS